MKAITQTLSEIVSQAFEIAGYDSSLGAVTASDRLDLCQFQCNGAFAAAKQYHKAPFIVAEQVAEVLKSDGIFSKVEVAKPGFLNLTLNDSYLLEQANAIACDPHLGVPQAEQPATIVLDYGGPNVQPNRYISGICVLLSSVNPSNGLPGLPVIRLSATFIWATGACKSALSLPNCRRVIPIGAALRRILTLLPIRSSLCRPLNSTKCTPLPVKKAKLMKPTLKKPTRPLMSCKMDVPDILLYGKRFCAPLSRI